MLWDSSSFWIADSDINDYIEQFQSEEKKRQILVHKRNVPMHHSRLPSSPFITGDGFRDICHYICDETSDCNEINEEMKRKDLFVNNTCIFVQASRLGNFVKTKLKFISSSRKRYAIITHNNDNSAPDGGDTVGTRSTSSSLGPVITTDVLEREFRSGRLIGIYSQNLWWTDNKKVPRKPFMHCLPIGIENRYNKIGRHPTAYIEAMRYYSRSRQALKVKRDSNPLLLVSFGEEYPDRKKAKDHLRDNSRMDGSWFNHVSRKLTHQEWLTSIMEHKFTLCPFGNGLDTHRITEVLLMGGIPVVRTSTINSCYDDTDNLLFNGTRYRGSLPVVILESWSNITRQRLESEWSRIANTNNEHWDANRLKLSSALAAIDCVRPEK